MNFTSRLISAPLFTVHGLIHLMGFFAYWPLMTLSDLPYKTTFMSGYIDFSPIGVRLLSLLWLASALGFMSVGMALILEWPIKQSTLWIVTLLSLAVTVFDFSIAFRGTLIDILILVLLIFISQTSGFKLLRGK